MSIFSDVADMVDTITNHPELEVERDVAIRSATLKLHLLEFWEEDRIEVPLSPIITDGLFQIAKTELGADRFRMIDYIQKGSDSSFLTKINPKNVFDDFGRMKTNVYYQVGSNINCRINSAESSILVGYFIAPIVVSDGYNSWIAAAYPHIVAVEAAALVLASIGQADLAKRLQALQGENLALLKINHHPES